MAGAGLADEGRAVVAVAGVLALFPASADLRSEHNVHDDTSAWQKPPTDLDLGYSAILLGQ